MKRLTERFSNGQAAVYGCGSNCKYDYKYCNDCYENCPTITEIYEKLAMYEDLEDSLFKIYGECLGLLETVVKGLVKHEGADIGKPVKSILLTDEEADKWKHLKNLEEQGLLLKLPCKVGDTIYIINQYAKEKVKSMKVLQIRFGELYSGNSFLRIDAINDEDMGESCYFKENVGKTVFLTKEEAEEALKRMEEQQ